MRSSLPVHSARASGVIGIFGTRTPMAFVTALPTAAQMRDRAAARRAR